MNNAFMMHASTSPFYPLFAALDINAKMHEGVSGRNMWMDCVVNGINARKLILDNCQHIRPFVPELVDGKPGSRMKQRKLRLICASLNLYPVSTGILLKATQRTNTLSIRANCC